MRPGSCCRWQLLTALTQWLWVYPLQDILLPVLMIGLTTFASSAAGVSIGNQFGARFKSRAEAAGGVILILMGTMILIEHLQV